MPSILPSVARIEARARRRLPPALYPGPFVRLSGRNAGVTPSLADNQLQTTVRKSPWMSPYPMYCITSAADSRWSSDPSMRTSI
jgi:hypothetical protein